MAAVAREYFTVDLRGLRTALGGACGPRDGVTESDVLRRALAVALRAGEAGSSDAANEAADTWPTAEYIKLSVCLMRPMAYRLGHQDARAAG